MTLQQHLAKRGRLSELSRAMGVSHSTVLRWVEARVPAERVKAVSAVTGIPPHELRPDVFDPPPQATAPALPAQAA